MAKLIWITGLAGSGKTTIGKEVFREMKRDNPATVFVDGDNFREVMGGSSGHTREERFAVAFQIARFCKFLVEQNIDVVCATISLFKEIHEFNRENFPDYFEIFIDCDREELVKRDQKGIYTKAFKGEIKNVVGIDIDFDKPMGCHLEITNNKIEDVNSNVNRILSLLHL